LTGPSLILDAPRRKAPNMGSGIGQVTEYPTPEKAFVPKLPEDLAKWILTVGPQ
jgi:hypothetical protein